jgi:predicted site-specific integrase-resolvase
MKQLIKNVVGYARISSDSQKDNTSIAEQKKRIQAYCTNQGWDLKEIFYDEAKSSSNIDERIEYSKMLQSACNKDNGIDAIIVIKSDRIHRHLKNLLIMIEDELQPHGVAFISVSENFDSSTPQGMLMLQMLGSFAEFERNLINERTISGRIITANVFANNLRATSINKTRASHFPTVLRCFIWSGGYDRLPAMRNPCGYAHSHNSYPLRLHVKNRHFYQEIF